MTVKELTNISLGADPEVFLMKDGAYISAHDIVPGTKYKPEKLKHCSIQADGMALEFNVKPARSAKEFAENVRLAIEDCKAALPAGVKMVAEPAVTFKESYFREVPMLAKQLGCDPDFSCFSGRANVIPDGAQEKPFRTGSGHLHISWFDGVKDVNDQYHQWDCRAVADRVHYWFNSLRRAWDKDETRASLYGLNGAIRYKPYGVEYRAPSNAWLNYPSLWPFLYEAVDKTVYYIRAGYKPYFRNQEAVDKAFFESYHRSFGRNTRDLFYYITSEREATIPHSSPSLPGTLERKEL